MLNARYKILISFFAFISILVWMSISFIKSAYFSQFLMGRVNGLYRIPGVDIRFVGLEIGLFPIRTTLMKPIIKTEFGDLEFDKVEIFFSKRSLLSKAVKAKNIVATDGVVKLKESIIQAKQSSEKFKSEEFFKLIEEKQRNLFLPYLTKISKYINAVEFNNVSVKDGKCSAFINQFSSRLSHTREINLLINLQNIKCDNKVMLDDLFLRSKITEERIFIEGSRVQLGTMSASLSGEVNASLNKARVAIEAHAGLANLEYQILKKNNSNSIADVEFKGNYEIDRDKRSGEIDFTMHKGKIRGANIGSMAFLAGAIENKIKVNKFTIIDSEGGKLNLLNPVTVDISKIQSSLGSLPEKVFFDSKKFEIGLIPEIISADKMVFSGMLDGKLSFSKESKRIDLDRDAKVKNFKITSTSDPIILIPEMNIENFNLTIVEDSGIILNGNIAGLNSKIELQGNISQESILFDINATSIDFKFLHERIAGLDFKGGGRARTKITGNQEKILVTNILELEETYVSTIYLGKVEGKVDIDGKSGDIFIDVKDGKINSSVFNGRGQIMPKYYGKGTWLDLKIDFPNGEIDDIKHALSGIIDLNQIIPNEVHGKLRAESNVRISGNNTPQIISDLKDVNVNAYGETFGPGNINLSIEEDVLKLKIEKLKKGSGFFEGFLYSDFKSKFIESEIKCRNLELREIDNYRNLNLGLNGRLNFEYYISGLVGDLTSRLRASLTDSSIGGKLTPDSFLSVYSQASEYYYNLNFAKDMIQLEGKFKISGTIKSNDQFYSKFRLNISDFSDIVNLVSSHNKANVVSGEIYANGEVSMQGLKPENLNSKVVIDNVNLEIYDEKIENTEGSSIQIKAGNIQEWNVGLIGKKTWLKSYGKGDIKNGIKIESNVFFPSDFLNLLSSQIQFKPGNVKIRLYNLIGLKEFNTYGDMAFQSEGIKWSKFAVPLTKVNSLMSYNGSDIVLQSLSAEFADGRVYASGVITPKFGLPKLNTSVTIENTHLYLSRNSDVISDINLKVTGGGPYTVAGNVNLKYGKIADRPTIYTFEGGGKDTIAGKIDTDGFLNFNIGLNLLNTLEIKNNFMTLFLKGGANLKGNNRVPHVIGQFDIVPQISRIKFKGHDFLIREGQWIGHKEKPGVYNYKVLGEAKIQDYLIKLDVVGNESNYNLQFKSEPVLSQEDILSLLALGVPMKTSRTFGSNDMRSMTGIGVGNLLFDQFGINEGLDKVLGVRLSVMPEYQDADQNPIQGRSAVSDQATAKTRTTTKIRLEKRINKNADISFTGTVGSNSESSQEMNVNYQLNKNISIKGVYEFQSNDSVENTRQDNSAGFDLQWKKTFK